MRSDVTFPSGETTCAAYLYEPVGESTSGTSTSVIVMAHGLGAIKEMGLDFVAERLCEAGWRVLLFDYRYFGASGGQPRQLLTVHHQRADWKAAVAYARTLPGVAHVGLFGSSFSGGHVIATAAADPDIAAVVAQCPFTSGLASSAKSISILPQLIAASVKDLVATARHREPVRVTLAGLPGDVALMSATDVVPGYLALVPEGFGFENEVSARFVLTLPLQNPGLKAALVKAPLFVAICDKDTVAPARASGALVRRAPRAEIHHYAIGHFDLYAGDDREMVLADELTFFDKFLPR